MSYTALNFYLKNERSIEFDCENITVDPRRIPGATGFHAIGEVNFLGCVAGGDWEHPVFFILYTDTGGDMAMYIPVAGNVVDWENGRAYDGEVENLPEFNAQALVRDVSDFLLGKAQP